MRRKLAVIFAAVAVASLGITAPAFAAGPGPNCPVTTNNPGTETGPQAGDCSISGSITVGTVFAIAVDFTSFNVTGTAVPTGNAGAVYVENNAGNAYSISETAENANFVNGTHLIPDNTVNAGTYFYNTQLNNTPSYVALNGFQFNNFVGGVTDTGGLSGGINLGGAPPVTGWDGFGVPNYYLNTAPQVPAGTYTNTIDFDLWTN